MSSESTTPRSYCHQIPVIRRLNTVYEIDVDTAPRCQYVKKLMFVLVLAAAVTAGYFLARLVRA